MNFTEHLNEPWSPWMAEGGEASDVVVSSRARVARNIADTPFPGRMNEAAAESVLRRVGEAVREIEPAWYFVELRDLLPLDRQVLVEKHLISPELAQNPRFAGLGLSPAETEAVMVNEEDHLRLQAFAAGLAAEAVYETVRRLDETLQRKLRFAFHPRLGYLTACPTNVGTGLRVSVMVHLAGLVHTGVAPQLLAGLAKMGVAVRGIYGEGTEAAGHLFQISNQVTLGRSEADLVDMVRHVAQRVVEEERKAREGLARDHLVELQDRVFRSLGILREARLMTAEEALSRISDVRLGREMGLLSRPSLATLSELMVVSLPGFLHRRAGRDLSRPERLALRASLIRELLRKEEI